MKDDRRWIGVLASQAERGPWRPGRIFWSNLLLSTLVIAVDWVTPAGITVGVALLLPVMLSSASDDPRDVWFIYLYSVLGKIVAAYFGAPAISPAIVWVPNRIFSTLTVLASGFIALGLQRRRLETVRARDEALYASDLNRMVLSLLAHDLRSPIVLSDQALSLLQRAREDATEDAVDPQMITEVRARLQRSLRSIEAVLSAARTDMLGRPDQPVTAPVVERDALAYEIRETVRAFTDEASARAKWLVINLDEMTGAAYRTDMVVLRQALSIVVDNAVRYAVPGSIRVTASHADRELRVLVEDQGPGLAAGRPSVRTDKGSGIGLELSRLLLRSVGGSLDLVKDSPQGTSFVLCVPAEPTEPVRPKLRPQEGVTAGAPELDAV